MRIAISSQYYHPAHAFGGVVVNAVALAEGLVALGHEVTVVTTTVVDAARPARRGRSEILNGVTVHYTGTWLRYHKSYWNPGIARLTRWSPIEFDALHVIGLYDTIGPPLAALARRRGVPYSVEPAGMLIPRVRSQRLKRLYHATGGRRLLSQARCVVVTSQRERDDAMAFGCEAGRLTVRRNGVHLEDYKSLPARGGFRAALGVEADEPLLLYLGRIDPIKNLDRLFGALAGLLDRPWRLAIVGPTESPSYAAGLAGLSRQLGIAGRLHWAAAAYGTEKLAAFADSDLALLVSTSENWGNVVQEAIAAGVPVLVSDTCGASEIVDARAGIVVPPTVEGIREGLRQFLDEPVVRERIKTGLPEVARGLSWEGPVAAMARMFESWRPAREHD